MYRLRYLGIGLLGLSCSVGCGAAADDSERAQRGDDQAVAQRADEAAPGAGEALPGRTVPGQPTPAPDGEPPVATPTPSVVPGGEPPVGQPTEPAPVDISAQTSASCVAMPEVAPRQPVLGYEEGCAVTSFVAGPASMSSVGQGDAREMLVGRWQLCGDAAYYGGAQHLGLEFGSNGRNQLLWLRGDALVALNDGPRGVYYLLGSGQFMQRGELSFGGYAGWARFDATASVMELSSEDPNAPTLRYVRVAPDPASAAGNLFSTASASCSMVGVWDTAQPSDNPPAAFAFNERGEWFGGEWGSDLCAAHTMQGTYNLETRGGNVQDNFDMPAETEFEIVTNTGAGVCAFWFNAGFRPVFSADCNRVRLENTWDNCTGGRGYLNHPGDELIRRVP